MVLEKIKKILSDQFSVPIDTITEKTNLVEDLGADSLDLVDILMSVEDEFDIEVPDESADNLLTVGEIVKYIKHKQ